MRLEIVKEEKIFDTIKQIVDELLEHENLKYSDITFLGEGAYNYVVLIGTKVLKLGEKRNVFLMENNKRFLKPVLRTEINKLNSEEILGCVEITEKVDTANITNEEVYIVYKELRDKGYYWADCGVANMGRLIRDNKVYYKNLNPTKEAINYTTENNDVLSSDELIILDNDYIFSESSFKKLPYSTQERYLENVEEYELKYQEELNSRRK